PVAQGYVQSLARPGGNITGFSGNDAPLMEKWLSLLKDIAPSVTRIAVIFNPDTTPYAGLLNVAINSAAQAFGMNVTLAPVRDDAEIGQAVAAHARRRGGLLYSLRKTFARAHRDTSGPAEKSSRLPGFGLPKTPPRAGALMSYYPDTIKVPPQAATYIDRILRGDQPADLPVQQ